MNREEEITITPSPWAAGEYIILFLGAPIGSFLSRIEAAIVKRWLGSALDELEGILKGTAREKGGDMFCPFLSTPTTPWACRQGECQLWEDNTGTCGLQTLAYLKGIETERALWREERAERKGRAMSHPFYSPDPGREEVTGDDNG